MHASAIVEEDKATALPKMVFGNGTPKLELPTL